MRCRKCCLRPQGTLHIKRHVSPNGLAPGRLFPTRALSLNRPIFTCTNLFPQHARVHFHSSSILLRALAIILESGERGFICDHSTRREDPSTLDCLTPWGLYVGAGWSMFTGIGTEKGRLPEFRPEAPTSTILYYISAADDFMSQQVPTIPVPGPRELFVAEIEKGQPSDHVPYAIVKMYELATRYGYVGWVIHLHFFSKPA